MEGLAIGIGILLAIFGPLLLVPVTWSVYRLVTLPWVRWRRGSAAGSTRPLALGAAATLVLVVMVVSYVPGRLEYERVCREHGVPTVTERVDAEGFHRNTLFAYEARRFLGEGGFSYVEGPDPYREGTTKRFSLGPGGELVEEDVDGPRSRYAVSETLTTSRSGTTVTSKIVTERGSGRELAHAVNISYSGGPLSLFLGTYGMSSCPDIRTAEGSEHFRTFYELERRVLRSGTHGPPAGRR